ncbi:hypothetical protein [Kitasatospora cathayae]|uniref:Transposase n=1 Tax=Kitasatospora cathayae TaxID=3004092 RepID=A0ABY7QGU9_9ACTN|nr:hypothetical protein [Kitasatospora sp. HUAS 3-15]WBP92026.1 hypothetical protein O1G21_40280 [Kitasatospora sp. HUAS 3-15]
MASTPPDFDAIADILYVLAPPDFTATRNENADQLKKTDPQLAKRIRALRRPTLAAWAANVLSHRHPDLVRQLLDLGQALRDAQEHLDGEQLRALAGQRRQVVRALTGQAQRDAATAGHPLGADAIADLDRTLSAALADPDAALALAGGRLTTTLEPPPWPGATGGEPGPPARPREPDARVDIEAGTGAGSPAVRRRPAAGRPTSPHTRAPRERSAEIEDGRQHRQDQELVQAREAAAAAKQSERESAERVGDADQALRGARSALRRAQDEAEQAHNVLARAQERDDRARGALSRADELVRAAEDAVHAARRQAAQERETAREAADRLRQLEDHGHQGGRAG